jgi:hypothetical protein
MTKSVFFNGLFSVENNADAFGYNLYWICLHIDHTQQ